MTAHQAFELATLIMFALYFVTAMVGMRLFGGVQSAVWFAGSSALRAMALALALFGPQGDVRTAAGSSVAALRNSWTGRSCCGACSSRCCF